MPRTPLQVGDRAPDFALPDQHQRAFRLSKALGSGPIVLFFYPKDETAVCVKEACAFRDAYQDFVDAGARVVGISSDSVDSHQAFARHHHLPYTLLADTQGKVRDKLGVPKTLGLFPGRATYVLDGEGVVRHRFVSQLDAGRHAREALGVVRDLVSRAA